MTENLKDTQTRSNLMRAFEGESMARNRYTIFSAEAKKGGYEQISSLFLKIAENEREHAKIFYKFLDGEDVNLVNYPYLNFPSCLGSTKENLICAGEGEREEAEFLYPLFSETAEKEGFKEIAKTFDLISKIEHHHMEIFQNLAEQIEENRVFLKREQTKWICAKCGYITEGKSPEVQCPVCHHDIGYFEVFCE
ncbi:rubrerythrin family protein [bacterium]|nr:rubrerythrin family protein [bacterium]